MYDVCLYLTSMVYTFETHVCLRIHVCTYAGEKTIA